MATLIPHEDLTLPKGMPRSRSFSWSVCCAYLRKREDFFIKVFKPQYNIKRYISTRDLDFIKHKCKVYWVIPMRIKGLLDKCLDPKQLDYNILIFEFPNKKRFYFAAVTPEYAVKANSIG